MPFSTILDLLGVDFKNERFDGRNLAPALRGAELLDPQHPVILYRRYYTSGLYNGINVGGELFGVVRGSMKLIDHSDQVADELYDLDSDPDETRNIRIANPEVTAELRAMLDEWKRRYQPSGSSDTGDHSLTEADRKALEALGYLDLDPEVDESRESPSSED